MTLNSKFSIRNAQFKILDSKFSIRNCIESNVILPHLERVLPHVGVVEAAVAGDFPANERRLLEGLIFGCQFHFSHYQPFVVTIELIHLEGVAAVGFCR